MRKNYNKLIRDRIPEIIEATGKKYDIEVMDDSSYRKMLLQKVVEEAQELVEASPEEIIMELADLYEVLDAVVATYNLSNDDVKSLQEEKPDIYLHILQGILGEKLDIGLDYVKGKSKKITEGGKKGFKKIKGVTGDVAFAVCKLLTRDDN